MLPGKLEVQMFYLETFFVSCCNRHNCKAVTCLLLLIERSPTASSNTGCLGNKPFVHSEEVVAVVAPQFS